MSAARPLAIGPLGALPTGVFTVNSAGQLMHIDLSGSSSVVGTGFGATSDLEFGPDGALYVSELSNDRVLRMAPVAVPVLDPAGWLVLALLIAATGSNLPVLRRPVRLRASARGRCCA